jgi:nucleoside-diphosphate-sugar epimerase
VGDPLSLEGQRILITGVTGSVADPVARALGERGSVVYGAARFSKTDAKRALEDTGVRTLTIDLETDSLDEVPSDLDYVLHFAVAKTNDFDRDLAANAEAVPLLIERVAGVKAFLHCSSTAVYEPHGHKPRRESDPLGDSHRPFGFMPTYSISKIAAESAARYACRRFGVPTVIARLNVPYGDCYGWPYFHLLMMCNGDPIPVHANAPSQYNPIHEDDIVASVPLLLSAASVPATTINWGGPDVVSIEEWCTELGELTGLEPSFRVTDSTIETIAVDTSKLQALGFSPTVSLRVGMKRLVAASRPELLAPL